MSNVGGRIYYDNSSGLVIFRIPDQSYDFDVIPQSVERDIESFKVLSERNRDTFDVIELEYGQYAQDFAESNGYRVNLETRQLEFSYPDPNQPEVEQPHQAPLSEQVQQLQQENTILKAQNNALSERADFIEDVVAEMAAQVYQ